MPAVFSNTGLEYPEITRFAHSFDNVTAITPKMRFTEVISTYGYPLISKEVAEAIYYARRIRSQSVQVEREREREPQAESRSNCWESERQTDSCLAAKATGQMTHTHTHRADATNCKGALQYQETYRRRPQLSRAVRQRDERNSEESGKPG